MSRATPKMRKFAERLIAEETRASTSLEIPPPVAFLVCDKLRPHLATFMGKTGFRALLSRALALAGLEIPWLRALQVNAEGSLEGLPELKAQVGSTEMAEGGVILLAQLLGLMAAFIGENLTLKVVSELWPKLSHTDAGFTKEIKNEKA
jgi:hypothetical protein